MEKLPITRFCSLSGKESKGFACPSDSGFLNFAADCLFDIAKCGVYMIVFNDDFRYGFLFDEAACLCENHIKRLCEITGDKVIFNDINAYNFSLLLLKK